MMREQPIPAETQRRAPPPHPPLHADNKSDGRRTQPQKPQYQMTLRKQYQSQNLKCHASFSAANTKQQHAWEFLKKQGS